MAKAQGATEYLVLLAVVLIIALVSVALLGFFPGMASDAQITQSQIYWQSASPIAVVGGKAAYSTDNTPDYIIMTVRVKNTGAYPIRITKILGGGQSISQLWIGGTANISDLYFLGPGEEGSFGPGPPVRHMLFRPASLCASSANVLCGLSSECNVNGSAAPGTAVVNNFGFEYIQYMDSSQITKRQVGSKPLIIKCTG